MELRNKEDLEKKKKAREYPTDRTYTSRSHC